MWEMTMAARDWQPGPLDPDDIERFTAQIPGLIRATGPVSYDYQFGTGDLLAHMVTASWPTPDTLFCAACTTAVVDGEDLLGIELGFAGPSFYAYKANLAALGRDLVSRGAATYDDLVGVTVRAAKASYLNAHIPDDVYYLHALATPPAHRGKGVGKVLLRAAIERARAAGYRALQLDVLADNPAVGFYQANGLEILAEIRSPELSRDHGFPAEYRMAVAL
jgi:ribosomal protein S18 acetylase RimI-like enzyme